MSNEQLLISSH